MSLGVEKMSPLSSKLMRPYGAVYLLFQDVANVCR